MGELNSDAPIGVFDSGVGGISVLKHIHAILPHEDLLYCADSRYAPYGNKSPQFICERAIYLADFLIERNAKALVVACNTATAAAVSTLRNNYQIPIIGMEPAVKPAVAITKTGVIGVLATSGTLKSAQFAALLEHYGHHVTVVTQACYGLVEAIEHGELDAESTTQLLKQYLEPLLLAGADTIVLGCTHYPFVSASIQKMVGESVALIDTGLAVAKQLQKRLNDTGLLKSPKTLPNSDGQVSFWTNSDLADAEIVLSRLWGHPISSKQFSNIL